MADPIRIANCSGFFGDRFSAAREMVEDGPIDVLTGDWLAELTLLILARIRAGKSGIGYARTFVSQMEQVMGTCLEGNIKVVANAGGLDPAGCARAVAQVAQSLGLQPRIAYVQGDDLIPRLQSLGANGQLRHFDSGEPVTGDNFLTANAYFGCWGIVEALHRGADIVITGRVTDAALICGPAAWHHGWRCDDWDALAGAVAAGHVIECGAQATGGNYAFFTEVADMRRVGFPWAEVAADGSAVIGKHAGTGGEVSIGTVTSQLLYEIGAPAYLGPDVTAHFDTATLTQCAPDRVGINGVRGTPPPADLKVCLNRHGGYRNEVTVALTGLDIEAKAALLDAAFWDACPYSPEDYAQVTRQLIHTARPDPGSNEEATSLWRLCVKDPDEHKTGRAFSNAMIEIGLASIPGFYSPAGGPAGASAFGVYEPALLSAEYAPQAVAVLGEDEVAQVSSVIPAPEASPEIPTPPPSPPAPDGPTVRQPLGRIAGARSGDKGGHANLGVFVRSEAAWAWLDNTLDTETLRRLLPEVAPLRIERYRLPNLKALNFVIHDLLDEGVAASTRRDAQAKSLGEWLRAREVEVPESLLCNGSV